MSNERPKFDEKDQPHVRSSYCKLLRVRYSIRQNDHFYSFIFLKDTLQIEAQTQFFIAIASFEEFFLIVTKNRFLLK